MDLVIFLPKKKWQKSLIWLKGTQFRCVGRYDPFYAYRINYRPILFKWFFWIWNKFWQTLKKWSFVCFAFKINSTLSHVQELITKIIKKVLCSLNFDSTKWYARKNIEKSQNVNDWGDESTFLEELYFQRLLDELCFWDFLQKVAYQVILLPKVSNRLFNQYFPTVVSYQKSHIKISNQLLRQISIQKSDRQATVLPIAPFCNESTRNVLQTTTFTHSYHSHFAVSTSYTIFSFLKAHNSIKINTTVILV